jgi:hypothetical protein
VKLRLARSSSSKVGNAILESSWREMKVLLVLLNLISLTAILYISGLLSYNRGDLLAT